MGEVETPGDQPLERLDRGRRRLRGLKLPISAIPTLPVLNPSACAPITLRVDAAVPPLVDAAEAVDRGSCSRCRSSRSPVRGRRRSRGRWRRPGRACRRSASPCGGRSTNLTAEAYRGWFRRRSSFAAPGRPRDDRRRAGNREAAQRLVLDRAPDVLRTQPATRARARGTAARRRRPSRSGSCRPASARRSSGPRAHGCGSAPCPALASAGRPCRTARAHASRQAPARPRPAALATRSSHRRAPRSLRPPTGRRGARAVRPDRLSSRPLAFDRYQ